MSQYNTDIKFKRSKNTPDELSGEKLLFGEPIFIDNTVVNPSSGKLTDPCNAYLAIGRKPLTDTEDVNVSNSPVIKAMSLDRADKLVFYKVDELGYPSAIINEAGVELPVNRVIASSISEERLDPEDATKYHILCQPEGSDTVCKFTLEDIGIFINGRGIMQGAAWNDYAEVRKIKSKVTPGLVVCDSRDGYLELSSERLQACPHVVSDTYGYLLGEISEDNIPIAVAGRVLVAMDESMLDIKIGDCVCAGLNGLASKMTRQEIINYPDRILGTVCEIPSYNHIGSIDVDDRIWINVK